MKRIVSLLLCAITLFTSCVFQTSAVGEEKFVPYVVEFELTSDILGKTNENVVSRASGLIMSYGIYISASGTSLRIQAQTNCINTVVKSGFKDLIVQRRKSGSSSWSKYYDYGDMYTETYSSNVNTTLAVATGYQYRVTCKHYAKKSLLITQTISNTSNIVTV